MCYRDGFPMASDVFMGFKLWNLGKVFLNNTTVVNLQI